MGSGTLSPVLERENKTWWVVGSFTGTEKGEGEQDLVGSGHLSPDRRERENKTWWVVGSFTGTKNGDEDLVGSGRLSPVLRRERENKTWWVVGLFHRY